MSRANLWLSAAVLAGSACGPSSLRVTARGFASGLKNHALARAAAENRALAQLGQLLEPEAVKLEVTVTPHGLLVESSFAGEMGPGRQVEFRPLEDGWMALASADRRPETAKAMAALPVVEVTGEARMASHAGAAQLALARALRALAEQTLGESAPGRYAGTATFVGLEYGFAAVERQSEAGAPQAPWQEVSVKLTAVAKLARTGEATAEDEVAVLRRLAIEHGQAAEWAAVETQTEQLAARTPESVSFLLLHVAALQAQAKTEPASQTLEDAVTAAGGDEGAALTAAVAEVRKTVGAAAHEQVVVALAERAKRKVEAAASAPPAVAPVPDAPPETAEVSPPAEPNEASPPAESATPAPTKKKKKTKKK